jgi:hypothetical protein
MKLTLRLGRRACPRCLADIQILLALAALVVPTGLSFSALTALGQQTLGRPIAFPTTIQWTKQKGVAKYRLQIASDENFRSIFFDGRVEGERYTASGLPPGYYYWRTAASDFRTGQFSKPVRFFISGGTMVPGTLPDKTTRRTRVRSVSKSH